MKKTVILKLGIRNFGSISSLTIDANGRDIKVSGHNGAGKSTLATAFTWLLFGKDAAGRRDDDIFIPRDKDGNKLVGHELEPTVEADLDVDGTALALKKVYAEQVPKRGPKKGTYQGSKVVYYRDGLEVKAGEYNAAVTEICDEDVFPKITDPVYLLNLEWKALRDILVPLVGELNVPMPEELKQRVGSRTYSDFEKLSAQQLKENEKARDKAHSAVEALYSNLPQKPEGDAAALEKEISDLKVKQSTLKYNLNNLEADDAGLAQRRAITEVEGNIQAARVKYREQLDAENGKVRDEIAELEAERGDKARADSMAQNKIDRLSQRIKLDSDYKQKKLGDYKILTADYKVEQAQQYDFDSTCPYCGQPLPPEKIEAAQAKFNADKSQSLESIRKKIDANIAEGKEIAASISRSQAELTDLQAKHDTAVKDIATLNARLEKGRAMIKTGNFEKTDEYKQLAAKLEQLKSASAADSEHTAKVEKTKKQLADIEVQISAKVQEQADFNAALKAYNDAQTRLTELATAEKDAGTAYDDACKADALCKDYDKAKSKALEKAVNAMFKHVQFSLFKQLDSGGERETCKVMVYNDRGMLSPKPSTGEHIAAGMEIINALHNFYGVSVPIFIDNAEGITKPIDTDAQLFKLCVTEDATLKVEVRE